jgi:hypothetical protein
VTVVVAVPIERPPTRIVNCAVSSAGAGCCARAITAAASQISATTLLRWRFRMAATADQYRIISEGAGWLRRADRGRLRIEGRDAIAFLQGL